MLPENCPFCFKYEKRGANYLVILEYGESREKFIACLDWEDNAKELLKQLTKCVWQRKDFRTSDVHNIYSGINPPINFSFHPNEEDGGQY